MYYKRTRRSDLSSDELDLARRAFRGKLLRHRFSPSFVLNNSDELLAKAHGDFARALSRGVEVADPVGFTVHCAWRHTQNLLRAEERAPASVSTEKAAELADAELPPDELALANDRTRKVQQALSKLNDNQRKAVALVFFEDMSWREAAEQLGWTPSKFQHHYEKAMEHLRRFLAVKSSDELAIDLGMAAWVSCAGASAHRLPGGFEAVLDKTSEGASGLWGKVHELARRLTPGGGGSGEQISVFASSGGGRALGTCATVAVACVVGGAAVVGPGIGASGSGKANAEHNPPISTKRESTSLHPPNWTAAAGAETSSTSTTSTDAPAESAKQTAEKPNSASATPRAESKRVEAQTSGIARAAGESGEPSSTSTASTSGSGESSTSEPVTVTSAPSQAPSAQEEASAQQQFGAFK